MSELHEKNSKFCLNLDDLVETEGSICCFFHNHFFCLQFSCANRRVSRRTILGMSQILKKKAKNAKTGGRQPKFWSPEDRHT